jgi:DNA-binding MarR family transcriptional regulator
MISNKRSLLLKSHFLFITPCAIRPLEGLLKSSKSASFIADFGNDTGREKMKALYRGNFSLSYYGIYPMLLWDISHNRLTVIMDNRIEVQYPKDMVVNIYPKPTKYLKDSHTRLFSDEALGLAVDRDLSGTDFRILLAIIGNLGYENILNISQKELQQQLSISQADISKSIKKLISKGYLQVVDKIGRRNIYMVNPNVVFKSRAKNLKELKHAWDKETIPNTQKSPIDTDMDLEPNLQDKLDDKVAQLSKQFGVPQSKVKQIILSLAKQTLENSTQDETELPY